MFKDLLKKRRTIRKYKNEKLSEEDLRTILSAGLHAPSGSNKNPWQFIVITDEENIKKAADLKEHRTDFPYHAAAIILVAVDHELSATTFSEDAAIATTLMQLQATDIGVGSCWIHARTASTKDGENSSEYLKKTFGIPDNFTVDMMLALGYPDEEKEEKEPQDFNERVHFERY